MPTFDLSATPNDDKDWALLKNSHVHLYWRPQILEETVTWLRARAYQIIAVDAGPWSEAADMHTAVARAFGFPGYYGRNLDALNDCLRDVALYEYGARRNATGTVLIT